MSDQRDDRDGLRRKPPPWGSEITPLTEVCGGQYVLLHEIARGELSIHYRAKPAGSRDVIGFKLLRSELAEDESQVRRFRREAELLRRIEHPNVVRLIDHGTIEDGRDFLALELLSGRTLADALAKAERMSPERACRIARQIGRALRSMHMAGVIHRDLRPENIMLIGPEAAERVKLVDFSAAGDVGAPTRRVREHSERRNSDVHGPSYRAPEQVRKRPPQPSMDVFALGVIMYEMLAGEHPFVPPELQPRSGHGKGAKLGAHTIRTKAFDAPEVLLGLVSECIEEDPADRPASMDDVLDRIDKALLWLGVVPHETTGGESDEDRRTQLWTAAEVREDDPPARPQARGGVGTKRKGPAPEPAPLAEDSSDDFVLDLVDDEPEDEPPPAKEPPTEAPASSRPAVAASPSRSRKPWEQFASSDAEGDSESRQGQTWSGLGIQARTREEASRARAQEEARRAEEEASRARAQEEARRAEEEARRAEEEASRARAQEEIRKAQEQARKAQEAARRAQEEARRAQEEASRIRAQQEEEARKAQEEARRAQEEARRAQEEARRAQEQARRERVRRDGASTGSVPRIDLDEMRERERSSHASHASRDTHDSRDSHDGRDNRDTPSSGSSPRIDLEDLERDSAPTGPRFVVDTVAWTKQQPSAEPTKGRKRTVAADGTDERASRSRSQTSGNATVGRPARPRPTAAHAPVETLPRWSFLLVVVLLTGLAYAAWMVWTQ